MDGDPCIVEGCDRRQTVKSARGMCPMHYRRSLAGASMTKPPGVRNGTTVVVFEELLLLPEMDECLLWPLGCTRQGYGKMVDADRRQVHVHVVVLERTVGPRPSPLHDACHSCRNRHCMNRRHLRWDTRSANSRDRHRDGTVTQAKLTADQVRLIRRRLVEGDRPTALAREFAVSYDTIYLIKVRKTWAHLPEEES